MTDQWFLIRVVYEITEVCFNPVTNIYRSLEYSLLWNSLSRILGDRFTGSFLNSLREYAKNFLDAYSREILINELARELFLMVFISNFRYTFVVLYSLINKYRFDSVVTGFFDLIIIGPDFNDIVTRLKSFFLRVYWGNISIIILVIGLV